MAINNINIILLKKKNEKLNPLNMNYYLMSEKIIIFYLLVLLLFSIWYHYQTGELWTDQLNIIVTEYDHKNHVILKYIK